MLIPYVYDPTIHDLFIYEKITTTLPSNSSVDITFYRPIQWNPGSPLYKYRGSMGGIVACNRYFTFTYNNPDSYFTNFNDPNNSVNDPVFKSTFQHTRSRFITKRLAVGCFHCYSGNITRNIDTTFKTDLSQDQLLITSFRFISATNDIIDMGPSSFIKPYKNTSDSNHVALTGVLSNQDYDDANIIETRIDIPYNALPIIDVKTIIPGTIGWHLDSNFKVTKVKFNSYVYQQPNDLLYVKVSYYDTPDNRCEIIYLDSGSFVLFTISPETIPGSGDGVVGTILAHVVSGGDLIPHNSATTIYQIDQSTRINNPGVEYLLSLGHEYPEYVSLGASTSEESPYGSSPFAITGLTFAGITGITGSSGITGNSGPIGACGYGPTGSTGSGITFFSYVSSTVNTVYIDGSVRSSDEITILPGNYRLGITGTTSGNFSPLASSEIVYNVTETYDGSGSSSTFPVATRLNFKNIKTNSSPFVEIKYNGLAPNGNEPSETIKVTYDVYNLGTTNITGGPSRSLVVNNPGNIQSGLTGTTYNIEQTSVGFGILNGAEQLVVLNPINFQSNNIQAWIIDPSVGSVFYLKDYLNILSDVNEYVSGHHIMIKKDVTTNSTKAFTVILPDNFNISTEPNRLYYSTFDSVSDIVNDNFKVIGATLAFKYAFEPNVVWQTGSYFCPSTRYDVINFISIGSRYVGIPAQYNTRLDVVGSITDPPDDTNYPCLPANLDTVYRLTYNSIYGVCCNTDCTCELGYNSDCLGYFYEGVTCGGSTGMCSNIGACCLYSNTQNIVVDCQELTFCDCASIASETQLQYKWNPFTTIKKSCLDFNCSNTKNDIGACCDGNGGCSEISSDNCYNSKGFFQGAGVNCSTSENLSVCVDGFGGCCDSGITCSAGITGSDCLAEFKSYFGDGTTCGTFVCSAADIPCYSIIENLLLSPGAEYDGGVVVGIFNPNQTTCFGSNLFDGSIRSFDTLTGTTLSNGVEYKSNYDYSGYGIDPVNVCDSDGDSYIVLISPHPVNLNDDDTLVDGSSNTHEFIWSNGSVAWGPLVNLGTNEVDEFTINNLSYKEGYIYDSGNTASSQLSLYGNSFLTCSSARFDTSATTFLENRPTQSMIGNWTRNYGLYNTIRLVGAEYFYYNIGVSIDGATMANYTPVSSEITAARALSIYNRNKSTDDANSTIWFIPSIDELAYLANQCRNTSEFNINSRLVELGYTPLHGWHWSSTGAFNLTNNEGIKTSSGITHGSDCWAIDIDVDGISDNMVISRVPRTNQHKVRPIKLIRCDKQKYSNTDENFKLWQVPILSESIINNQ